MTWSRFDDAARKHPKAVMAGNDAWGFWCAAIMYSNQYGTDGFVPDAALATELLPVPISKGKALKLAEACCRATVVPGGPGLLVRDEARGGFIIHDFLDWNPSKSEIDSKRKADRDRKRRTPEAAQESNRLPHRIPNGVPDGIRTDSEQESERSRASARALPARPARPAQPSPDEERAESSSLDLTDSETETTIPLDLVARAERHGVFGDLLERMPGIHAEQLRDKARSFVAYWSIGGGTGKRRRHWMRRLRQELVQAWEQGKLAQPPAARDHRPPPQALKEPPVRQLGPLPPELQPKPKVIPPQKSREEQLEELRRLDAEGAFSDPPEATTGANG